MPPATFKSICSTIRPKNGVDNYIEAAFIKYIKKQEYAFVVAEKIDNERHLHIQFWFAEPRELGTVTTSMKRIQEKVDPNWDSAAHKVLSKGIKHAYNDDFYKEYLNKKDSVILYKKIPDSTSEYYPTQEYQDQAILIKNAKDKQFAKLSYMFTEWFEERSASDIKTHKNIIIPKGDYLKLKNGKYLLQPTHVAQFLSHIMFTEKSHYVVRSTKAKREMCSNLYFYIVGGCEESVNSFLQEEQHCFNCNMNKDNSLPQSLASWHDLEE